MSRKHNTKHLSRGTSNYGKKVAERGVSHLTDVTLSDGKKSSAKR